MKLDVRDEGLMAFTEVTRQASAIAMTSSDNDATQRGGALPAWRTDDVHDGNARSSVSTRTIRLASSSVIGCPTVLRRRQNARRPMSSKLRLALFPLRAHVEGR